MSCLGGFLGLILHCFKLGPSIWSSLCTYQLLSFYGLLQLRSQFVKLSSFEHPIADCYYSYSKPLKFAFPTTNCQRRSNYCRRSTMWFFCVFHDAFHFVHHYKKLWASILSCLIFFLNRSHSFPIRSSTSNFIATYNPDKVFLGAHLKQ